MKRVLAKIEAVIEVVTHTETLITAQKTRLTEESDPESSYNTLRTRARS